MAEKALFRLEAEKRGNDWQARIITGAERFYFAREVLNPSRIPQLVLDIPQDLELLPDVLTSDRGVLLVNDRVGKVLDRLCPFDVQLARVELRTRTGTTDRYKALNVLCRFALEVIENSLEFRVISGDRVYFLTKRTVRSDLRGHLLVQDEQSRRVYVAKALKSALQAEDVTGVVFKRMKERLE